MSRITSFLRDHPSFHLFLIPDGTKCICAILIMTSMIGWLIQSYDLEDLSHMPTPESMNLYRTRWMALVPINVFCKPASILPPLRPWTLLTFAFYESHWSTCIFSLFGVLGTCRLLEGPKWTSKELFKMTLFVQLLTGAVFILIAYLLWIISESNYYIHTMSLNGTWPIVAAYSIALRHSYGNVPMVSAFGLITYRAKYFPFMLLISSLTASMIFGRWVIFLSVLLGQVFGWMYVHHVYVTAERIHDHPSTASTALRSSFPFPSHGSTVSPSTTHYISMVKFAQKHWLSLWRIGATRSMPEGTLHLLPPIQIRVDPMHYSSESRSESIELFKNIAYTPSRPRTPYA